MSELTNWLDKAIKEEGSRYFTFRSRLALNNGVTLSIQGNDGAYCSPRINTGGYGSGIYDSMEIGFPSSKIDLIMEYAEDKGDPTGTVYPYTPMSVIEDVVSWGGGIKGLETEVNK